MIEQLAGDLLPDATREQKIASGFNRNHMINFEGGAIAEEYQVEYVIDRVEATSSRVHGPDDGVRAVPYAQVRPDHPQGVLPVLRVLQHRPRAGARRPHRQRRAGAAAALARTAGAARRARTPRSTRAKRRSPTRSSRRCSAMGERDSPRRCRRSTATGLVAHYELDGSFSDISGRVSARPHGRRRSDVRRRPDRPRGVVRRRHRGQLRQRRRLRAHRAVQRRALAEGPRQPADGGASRSSTTPSAAAATSGASTTSCSSTFSAGPRG